SFILRHDTGDRLPFVPHHIAGEERLISYCRSSPCDGHIHRGEHASDTRGCARTGDIKLLDCSRWDRRTKKLRVQGSCFGVVDTVQRTAAYLGVGVSSRRAGAYGTGHWGLFATAIRTASTICE